MAVEMPTPGRSLSARLLLLTIGFVMLAEVLIFLPSIARFREDWLTQRLAAGHLAILALEATPERMVSPELEVRLLAHVGALAVGMEMPGKGKLMLSMAVPSAVAASYDLRRTGPVMMMGDALAALVRANGDRLIRVVGTSPKDAEATIDMVIEEGPLRAELAAFALRILGLSLLISLLTAAMVYLSLLWLMVRPLRRLTQALIAFRDDPEGAPLFEPQARSDELGLAARELTRMQRGLREALGQQARLAALGTAVSKISHDLRNILATTRLVSDRLAESADPAVRRLTPTLLGSIDRAVNLCEQTLSFVREGRPPLQPSRFLLADLVAEVGSALPAPHAPITWIADLPADLRLEADRAQLFRVLANLAQNALEAGASRLAISARPEPGGRVAILVADNGPGLPPRAREHLFQPFRGSSRPGSSGLGLAIAREIVNLHGGELALVESGAGGTTFRIELPQRAANGRPSAALQEERTG
jgi:signal transduction histidine kinase